jgi:hypothetical protein
LDAKLRQPSRHFAHIKLASVDRSHPLEKLTASLDVDPEVEAAWRLEADRREAEIESGESVPISGPEAVARLRARLER